MEIKNDESLFIDFIYQDGEIPPGYEATYELDTLNGNLAIKDDRLLLRIKYQDMQKLSKGKTYKLEVAFFNQEIGFKEYIISEDIKVV